MGLLNKLGIGNSGASRNISRQTPPANAGGHQRGAGAPPIAIGPQRTASPVPETNRVSNGLKEFLWNLDGLGRGTLLDLGPAWQTTLNFFIERGFRVTSDDLLHSWKDFLAEEEKRLQKAATSTEAIDLTPAGRAARFVQASLQYSPSSFDAILLWDNLDYLEPAVAKQTVSCLTEILRPGGIVFAMFHSKKPESFQRYRPLRGATRLPESRNSGSLRKIQNREIVCRPRPTTRIVVCKIAFVVRSANSESVFPLFEKINCIFCCDFSCFPRCTGVHPSRELTCHGKRRYDSTGLRAKH